jgi:hypothetical protein
MGGEPAIYSVCMTCEVAILNRRGVALAAAGSNAIFPISSAPVAIMTLGTSLMDVPWEVAVENYAHELGERMFASLEEYADNFFDYIETSNALFPPEKQAECFRRCVRSVWSDYRDRIQTCGDSLSIVLAEDRRELLAAGGLSELEADFGTRVVDAYASELDELENEIFGDMKLPKPLRIELRAIVALMYGKDCCHPADDNSVVFAGMGDDDPFPSVLAFAVSTVAAGKLRRAPRYAVRIGPGCGAGVMPFGRRETIDTLVEGIHPDLLALVSELRPHAFEDHSSPFMTAIADLSRGSLARMAESLVTLSAIDEPLQVALLTKGDGFRRRRLGGASLRLAF